MCRPRLDMDNQIFAFIDILGFGRQVMAAKDEASLLQAWDKLHRVQEAFQKASATEDPPEQAQVNQRYGKFVMALSDAVLIAINVRCEARQTLNANDHIGWSIYELIQAQYDCVLADGIFLRGGLSFGPFHFANDILLSPALVDAHDLESKHADAPVIALSRATLEWIRTTAAGTTGVPGWKEAFFQSLNKQRDGQPLYFLDYLRVALTDDEDQEAVLRSHARLITAGRTTASDDSVRRKYTWLINYHNTSITRVCPNLAHHAIATT